MQRINKLLFIGLLLTASIANAGLISRTYTYTSGNTIDPNQNNTNENTLYNEVNGNISTTNILDGTILNGDLADTQIAVTKFASVVQSTFTSYVSWTQYRRPTLKYYSSNAISVDTNTTTTNQTCIFFKADQRCITDDVSRLVFSSNTASLISPYKSGLYTGLTEGTTYTWWAFYGVKATDSSTQFVIVGSSMTPRDFNGPSKLNAIFGTDGWVYLGVVPLASDGDFKRFSQSGNYTAIAGRAVGSSSGLSPGGFLYQTATNAAASIVLNYAVGMSGLGVIPNVIDIVYLCASRGTAGGASTFSINDSGDNYTAIETSNGGATDRLMQCLTIPAAEGIKAQNSGSQTSTFDITIKGWFDNSLSSGGGQL